MVKVRVKVEIPAPHNFPPPLIPLNFTVTLPLTLTFTRFHP
jgi:hypothetical protein